MKIIALCLILLSLFLIGCQEIVVEESVSTEEAEIDTGLDELDELDQLEAELEEDINFDELENLDLE